MHIEVLLFAAARDAAHDDSIVIEVDDNAIAGDVIAELGRKLPELTGLLPSCRLAIDCTFVDNSADIPTNAEIALIPPVSGG